LADLPAGQTATVLITGTVASGATGSLMNSASTTTPTPDPSGGTNTTTGTTPSGPSGPVVGDTAKITTKKVADKTT
jgi:hypothetical protein